jgi:hypothetical protein
MFTRLIRPLQLLILLTALAAAIFAASPGGASTPSNPDGYFVVGDNAASAAGASGPITWWSNSWWADNALSGGLASSQFKGYAITFSGGAPVCGGTWTTGPGNSPHPPDSVSGTIRVIIASLVTASADTITDDIVGFGTVATDPGYGPSPGRRGTGTIIVNFCGGGE